MMFDRQAKPALVVTAVTLIVCGVGFRFAARAAEAYFAKQPVDLRHQLTNIPKQLGPWRAIGQDVTLTAEPANPRLCRFTSPITRVSSTPCPTLRIGA
jgi:hypothetical protein